MSDAELRDELMTLLVAGHETTATSLAWAVERLVRHPGGAGAPGAATPALRRRGGQGDAAPAPGRRARRCAGCSSRSRSAATSCRPARRSAPCILLVHRRDGRLPRARRLPARALPRAARPAPTAGSRSAAACAAAWAPPSRRSRCRSCCRRWPSRCAWRRSAAPSPCAGAASRSRRPAAGRCARSRLASLPAPRARPLPAARPAPRRAAARPRRRAHAARHPRGELLVPPPPGRLRVDRRARRRRARRRPRVRRGLRLRRAGRAAPTAWSASTPTPTRTSTRACATARPTCASCATWSRPTPSRATPSSSCRRSSTSTTPTACSRTSRACSRPGGTAYVSTPNVLTLAPEGAERSGNPWHLREYRAEEFRALCAAHFGSVELYGLFHARTLRVHELALRAGLGSGPRRAAADRAASTTASCPPSPRATSPCAPSATSIARWTSWPC